MRGTTVQTFTASVGRRYFVVFPWLEDSRVPTTSDALTEKLELLDVVLDGPLEARLLGLHSQDRQQPTSWLERTGWIIRLGSFTLQLLALSVNLSHTIQVDTPVWIGTTLDRMADAFTTLWAIAEHRILTEPMYCTLALLKSCKKNANFEGDNAPFRPPGQQATRNRYRKHWLTCMKVPTSVNSNPGSLCLWLTASSILPAQSGDIYL